MVAAAVLLAAGCANLREAAKAEPEEDPLRGSRRPAAIASAPAPTNLPANQLPSAPDAAPEMPTLPVTLAPTNAALTVAPRLRGGTYLGIDTPAAGGRGQPVQQTGWTGSALSREQAWEQLRARGVTWQQLERHGDQWRLRCAIPNPTKPDVSRFYESIAVDEVSAIWAVIEKIDGQR